METLKNHINDILTQAIQHSSEAKALLVFDQDSGLSMMLADAYKAVLPEAMAIDFNVVAREDLLAMFDACAPGDLVVMIQSGSFRLDAFRFRLELFKRGLAVIEHPHLGRMPEEEWPVYIDALAYDQSYYRSVGPRLKDVIDRASRIVVSSGGKELVYEGGFEEAKLNIGDYSSMKNVGGQFPIGEVFTEPVDFARVNGEVVLFAYGNEKSRTERSEPFPIAIREGKIVDASNAPASFNAILEKISQDEPLWIRELGFGLNRAMTRTRTLHDVGSYERMCGVHLSIGQKHTIYKKPGFPKRTSKYHVDVFADVQTVSIDGVVVFENGEYTV